MILVEDEKVNAERQQTTVTHINDIMTKLKYTAEQAMDLLSVPPAQRSMYAGLVGEKANKRKEHIIMDVMTQGIQEATERMQALYGENKKITDGKYECD